ncbi:MAG: 16S rRNA (guanine(527)-N(7))-methyltransferase RsmG [Elusimicrobiales bacterium]|nr:16S rRNA (guanine(527)-N(7))-methyltransferase RsmG [Elusimicrobiales bacterium]
MEEIKKELNKYQINVDLEKIEKFTIFIKEVIDKNTYINLISKYDINNIIERHLIDSIIAIKDTRFLEVFNKKQILDIGSGGGFPSIPLAIIFTNSHFTLSDSSYKKYEFLLWIKEKLKLNNIDIINQRINQKHFKKYDVITQRAASKFEDLYKIALKLLEKNGFFVSWLSYKDAKKYEKNFNFIYNYNLKGREMSICFLKKGEQDAFI